MTASDAVERLARRLDRRDWLRVSLGGLATGSVSGWFDRLAAAAIGAPTRNRSCILLWMTGGPSQIDTFDPKPGHENGGPFRAIDTSVPGLQFSEHLPKLAEHAQHLAIVRSMSTREGDHSRATYLMRTGYVPGGPVDYPSLGPLIAKEMEFDDATLPSCVSVGPYRFFNSAAYGAGFLGPLHAPLVVGETGLGVVAPSPDAYNALDAAMKVPNLSLPKGVDAQRATARRTLLDAMENDFAARHPEAIPVRSRRAAYEMAARMMEGPAGEAFELSREPARLRDAYGRHPFGQGCLLARRLVERGVPFVEVSLNGVSNQQAFGWDTHSNNFPAVEQLSAVLDAGWGTLMHDLKSRGLLDSTTILWMGEFGRTPRINRVAGRDHYPNAWSVVLAGGGIVGGQAIGATSPDGMEVTDRPVSVGDLVATLLLALGLDPWEQNMSNVGRPIRLADPESQPIQECLS